MTRRHRQTFEETLLAVRPRNGQALEHKARTASSLAESYPESEQFFRAIEDQVACHLLKIYQGLSLSAAA